MSTDSSILIRDIIKKAEKSFDKLHPPEDKKARELYKLVIEVFLRGNQRTIRGILRRVDDSLVYTETNREGVQFVIPLSEIQAVGFEDALMI